MLLETVEDIFNIYANVQRDGNVINRMIHQYDEHKNGSKDFLIYEYEDYKIIYHKESKLQEGSLCCYIQLDQLYVYKNNELIMEHHPRLDPWFSWEKNIITLSSDGEIWVYDLLKNKELSFAQGIVAFYQCTEVEEIQYYIENDQRIPYGDARIVIEGDGCPWGCESDEIHFALILDYDLNVIDYSESRNDDDEWDNYEEDEEDGNDETEYE